MLKNENYLNIQGWMLNELHLKGNRLLIYALIYGFCQDGFGYYNGSLEYIQEWTNSTRQGVINAIKSLIDDGLIIKEQGYPNNKYTIVTNANIPSEQDLQDECKQNLQVGKQSLQTYNNINNNYSNNNIKQDQTISEIIDYLNKKCNTRFRATGNSTKRVIKARLKEGASIQDFKDVIDYKYEEWGRNPVKFSQGQWSNTYLRPSTLFGSKMEEYLEQAWMAQCSEGSEVKSVERSSDRSDISF